MDAKELRIGNWVIMEDGKSRPILWSEFGLAKKFNPIPLTEEWLKIFGLWIGMQICTDVLLYKDSMDKLQFVLDSGAYVHQVGIHLEYVHQLQNFFFSLTGKELTKR